MNLIKSFNAIRDGIRIHEGKITLVVTRNRSDADNFYAFMESKSKAWDWKSRFDAIWMTKARPFVAVSIQDLLVSGYEIPADTNLIFTDEFSNDSVARIKSMIRKPTLPNTERFPDRRGFIATLIHDSVVTGRIPKKASDTSKWPSWMGECPRLNSPWSKEEDQHLKTLWEFGHTEKEIAQRHGRGIGGIQSRLARVLGTDRYLSESDLRLRGQTDMFPTCGRSDCPRK